MSSVEEHVRISDIAAGAWEVGWHQSQSASSGPSNEGNGGNDGFDDALLRVSARMNRAITTDPGVQQHPSIAVNPLDPDHLVVAYMDRSLVNTGYTGIATATSRNAGLTTTRRRPKTRPTTSSQQSEPVT